MATKKELLDELDWLTDKISTQIWTLNLGTLATTWSLLIAGGSVEKLRIGPSNAIPIMVLCIIGMLCELGQYLAGYFNAKSILDRLESSGHTEFEYDKSAPLYIARKWLFCGKVVLSLVAAIWLVVVLARKFI
jgi:hypothetical protein